MITANVGSLGLNKAMVASIFAVSRSAVTQSCAKKESIEQDFIARVYRYLRRFSKNASLNNLQVSQLKQYLIEDVKIATDRRSIQNTGVGRKRTQINFKLLRKLIWTIANTLLNATIISEKETGDTSVQNTSVREVQEKVPVSISNTSGFGF